MRAMVLSETKTAGPALREMEWPKPEPGSGEILVQIHACAVCRTDLHVVDGDLPDPKLPLVPGHQIVGRVVDRGANAHRYEIGWNQNSACTWYGPCESPSATEYRILSPPPVKSLSVTAPPCGAISCSTAALLKQQRRDGHWVFELEADATISAEYVILQHYLGEYDAVLEARIASYLRRLQVSTGSTTILWATAEIQADFVSTLRRR